MSSNPAVAVEAIRKSYNQATIVHQFDLAIGQGELVTLLGPSGCGKTTILRMIAGFAHPSSGRISIAGNLVTDLPPHRRQVGLMFQSYALFPHMTVGENVAFGLKMRRLAKDEIAKRVFQALESVRLDSRSNAYPRQLSGGQQQRVALARALVINPDVLLLDEPFGALDRELRQHLQEELKRLQRNLGISTLLVTHDQEEALMLSDRIVIMNAGRIEQIGGAQDIYERPKTRFVAEFMGGTNLLSGQIRKGSGQTSADFVLDNGLGLVPLPTEFPSIEGSGVVIVRPEQIRLSAISASAIAQKSDTSMTGRIIEANYLGATTEYRVVMDKLAGLVLVARTPSANVLYSRDMPVTVSIPAEAIHFIA